MVRSIAQMQNRPTSYEVGVYVEGKLVKVLGYTARKSLRGLDEMCHKYGSDVIVKHLTEEDLDLPYKRSVKIGISFANGKVIINFTGRTERDVASSLNKIY